MSVLCCGGEPSEFVFGSCCGLDKPVGSPEAVPILEPDVRVCVIVATELLVPEVVCVGFTATATAPVTVAVIVAGVAVVVPLDSGRPAR